LLFAVHSTRTLLKTRWNLASCPVPSACPPPKSCSFRLLHPDLRFSRISGGDERSHRYDESWPFGMPGDNASGWRRKQSGRAYGALSRRSLPARDLGHHSMQALTRFGAPTRTSEANGYAMADFPSAAARLCILSAGTARITGGLLNSYLESCFFGLSTGFPVCIFFRRKDIFSRAYRFFGRLVL
jgi:hypothetical protein